MRVPATLVTIFLLLPSISYAQKLDGAQVMQRQFDSQKGFHDDRAIGRMVLINPKGKKTERAFELRTLEKTATSGTKSLLKINEPIDLKGTALLAYQNTDREDDQWLYLPALKKTKRIAGSGKGARFIGSDFTFEDLSAKDVAGYQHQVVAQEVYENVMCYVVESISKEATSSYAKTQSWVRADNFQFLRTDLYDKNGELIKRGLFSDYQQVNGQYWRPFKVRMQDLKKKRESQMVFESIKVNTGLRAADFTKSVLER